MNAKQIYYCDVCDHSSEDRFVIEYHESIPDPPPLPVKVGDKIWVESYSSDDDDDPVQKFVLRTISKISIVGTIHGIYHIWMIGLDFPITKMDPDGYSWETRSIVDLRIKTVDGQLIDMLDYKIKAYQSVIDLRKQKSDFYKDFSG